MERVGGRGVAGEAPKPVAQPSRDSRVTNQSTSRDSPRWVPSLFFRALDLDCTEVTLFQNWCLREGARGLRRGRGCPARCERAAMDRTSGGSRTPGGQPPSNDATPNNKFKEFFRNADERLRDTGRMVGTRLGEGMERIRLRQGSPGESTPSPTGRGRRKPRASPGAWSRFGRKDARVGELDLAARHEGASRDRTELFAQMRTTAKYVREMNAKEQAENELRSRLEREGWSNGYDANDDDDDDRLTPGKRIRNLFTRRWRQSEKEEDTSDKDELEEVSPHFAAMCEAADALAPIRRKIENNLLPQYESFVASLSTAADAAAALDARPAAQTNVETHLATLLLVEQELQGALKLLKQSHMRAMGLRVTLGDPEEECLKRNVVNAHMIARQHLTGKFKRARDSVSAMLKGNAAAKVVAQQRMLIASAAAYDELERFYKRLVRLGNEAAAHPAVSDAGREGERVRAAFLAAAKTTKGALRAAFEESTDVKKGTYGIESEVDGFKPGSWAYEGTMEETWRAHCKGVDGELAKYKRAVGSPTVRASSLCLLPREDSGADVDRDERSVDAADVADAAVELVRDQLRNAVDAIEDAARACAMMAASSSGSAGSTPSTPRVGAGEDERTTPSGGRGNLFGRTAAALVPVKNAVAELFRALHALAATARRVGGEGVRGAEVGTPTSGSKRSPLAKVKTWWKERISPGFGHSGSPSPNR